MARGAHFVWRDVRYQVKANRPSGLPGSRVTLVLKARNYDWDLLLSIVYDTMYWSGLWTLGDRALAFWCGLWRFLPSSFNCYNLRSIRLPAGHELAAGYG